MIFPHHALKCSCHYTAMLCTVRRELAAGQRSSAAASFLYWGYLGLIRFVPFPFPKAWEDLELDLPDAGINGAICASVLRRISKTSAGVTGREPVEKMVLCGAGRW